MKRATKILEYQQSEFNVLNKSAMWLGNVAMVFITPFAVNNLMNGRWKLFLAALVIILFFAFNTYTVLVWKKYYTNFVLFFLTPAFLLFLYMSITHQGIIGILWSFPAIAALYYLLPERQAWLINTIGLVLCTHLALTNFETQLASRIIATLTLVSIVTAVSIRLINKQQISLHRMAITDSLTGLYNRNTLNSVLNEVIKTNHKTNDFNHLMTLDIDNFKKINDQFGHDKGDEALKIISNSIKQTVGNCGVVFRYGGEEFIAVIEDLSWEKAKRLAEGIRTTVEVIDNMPGIKATVSIGVSRLKTNMTRIDWIRESDRNLYTAKNQGRNQVISS